MGVQARIVAHHTYPKASGWDVSEVGEGATQLKTALAQLSGVVVADDSDRATDEGKVKWLDELAESTGPLVVYWGGHGEFSNDGYLLAFPDSGPNLAKLHSLTGDDLASVITSRQNRPQDDADPDWLVLILDSCQSVQGARYIWDTPALKDRARNTAVMATSNESGSGYGGRFPGIFESELSGFGENEAQVDLVELLRRVGDALDEEMDTSGNAHLHTSIRRGTAFWPRKARPEPLTGVRADLTELRNLLAGVPDTVRNHYYAKAASVGLDQLDWTFTGRGPERAQIASWMGTEGPANRLFAVTGTAGSGKSALLGMVLASTSPELVQTLREIDVPFPAGTVPDNVAFTSTVHLSNRTLDEIIREIAAQEGFPDIQRAEDLSSAFAESDTPRLVLADALDESRDPYPIARMLRSIASQPQCRVLVGTRRSLNETPDNPNPGDYQLIEALAPDDTLTIEASDTDFHDYALRRLTRGLAQGREGLREDFENESERLADAVVQAAPTFLYVRLAVDEIIADQQWTDPDVDLAELLTPTHIGIFDRAMHRLGEHQPHTEHMLHALAYARGNGFPRTGRVWEVAGSAIAGTPLTDPDVRRALTTGASYIVQDAEFGYEVYRLAHRTFTEYYQARDTQ